MMTCVYQKISLHKCSVYLVLKRKSSRKCAVENFWLFQHHVHLNSSWLSNWLICALLALSHYKHINIYFLCRCFLYVLLLDQNGYTSCSCSFLFTQKVIPHTTIAGSFLLSFIISIPIPVQTQEWTKSLTKLEAINLNDQHFESMESPRAAENPPGQLSFLKAYWLLDLFPFCNSIIM